MRLTGGSVKVEKYEKAVMFAGERDGFCDQAGVEHRPARAGKTASGANPPHRTRRPGKGRGRQGRPAWPPARYFGDSTISICRPSMRG